METFDFDYHTFTTKYPESAPRMKLGGSYTYAVTPDAPDQRIIVLRFGQMRYICNPSTGAPDYTSEPKINLNRLEKFYRDHRLHRDFIYVHPNYGSLVVKFSKPLETPRVKRGGWSEEFTIELEEQP